MKETESGKGVSRIEKGFEGVVSDLLVEKSKNTNRKKIVYTSFSSKNLLQEYNILGQFSKNIDERTFDHMKVNLISKKYKELDKSSVSQFEKKIRLFFPRRVIAIKYFFSIEKYLANAKKVSKEYPDVIAAINLNKEEEIVDYRKLCFEILKRNPSLYNVWIEEYYCLGKNQAKARMVNFGLINNKKFVNIVTGSI